MRWFSSFILVFILSALGINAYAGTSSNSVDSLPNRNQNCFVEFSDTNVIRYINISYIRSVDLTAEEYKDATSPKIIVNLRMASNYANKSVYSVNYGNEQAAKEALKSVLQKIATCK